MEPFFNVNGVLFSESRHKNGEQLPIIHQTVADTCRITHRIRIQTAVNASVVFKATSMLKWLQALEAGLLDMQRLKRQTDVASELRGTIIEVEFCMGLWETQGF